MIDNTQRNNKEHNQSYHKVFFIELTTATRHSTAGDHKYWCFTNAKKCLKRYERKEHFILSIQVSIARVDVSAAKVLSESIKRQKIGEASGSGEEQSAEKEKELSEEELQKLLAVVLVEEVYVEALQVKYPTIDWEVYSEDTRSGSRCYKISRNLMINKMLSSKVRIVGNKRPSQVSTCWVIRDFTVLEFLLLVEEATAAED
ncbi:hypothetical protein Tco_0250550 [Tanacetum coccineum]